MTNSSEYKTKQRQAVENCLKNNENQHFTVDMMVKMLEGDVSRITVYRHLERLVQQGKIRKCINDKGTSACYQYINNENCHSHFHLKCVKCGKLIHLDCEEMESMKNHIALHHNFKINSFQTVICGICGECDEK